MPCCKKKFAKTNEKSDSRLSGSMLNVCEEEMSKIKFFGTSKEIMDEIYKSPEEQFSWGNIVPGT